VTRHDIIVHMLSFLTPQFLRLPLQQPLGEIVKSFVWIGRQEPNVYATKDPLWKSVIVVELFKEKSKLSTRGPMIVMCDLFKHWYYLSTFLYIYKCMVE